MGQFRELETRMCTTIFQPNSVLHYSVTRSVDALQFRTAYMHILSQCGVATRCQNRDLRNYPYRLRSLTGMHSFNTPSLFYHLTFVSLHSSRGTVCIPRGSVQHHGVAGDSESSRNYPSPVQWVLSRIQASPLTRNVGFLAFVAVHASPIYAAEVGYASYDVTFAEAVRHMT